ncbi:LITAF-like zinc ribbon domain-containing protein [Bisporella sp. PMI_857]|nr:LITAF-like zinc ribbon domain-containing protein [Bisporella sp. PMI_857]
MAPKNTYAYATPLASLTQGPAPVDCPSCGVRELTRQEFESGGTTHLMALLFCCVACLGCVPYIATWFKDVRHLCGRCGVHLATWHKSGHVELMPVAHQRA